MRVIVLILWAVLASPGSGLTAGENPPVPGARSNLPSSITSPPLPQATKTPVSLFRELLAMEPYQRKQSLTNRPPETQKRILAKLREYELMPADERELRLQATELRWYLRPLMNQQPADRGAATEVIPEEYRILVKHRLQLWDVLPPPLQRELLDNEATIHFFTELNAVTDQQRREMLARIPADQRAKLEAGIRKWNSIPENERRNIVLRFNQFFELNDREKTKALGTLSEPERQQLERTLKRFEGLPSQQRAQCIRSFEKFAGLTLSERQQFLRNAERWNSMTPQERQNWRQLVAKLSLMPSMPVRMPPLPVPVRPKATTNAGISQN